MRAEPVTPALLRGWPLPAAAGGKESRGRTLIIGGSAQTPGAVLLAAEAALRCGAGKLQVATAASVAAAVACALPEALVRGLPETSSGAIAGGCGDAVRGLVRDADCVLVGCGLTDPEAAAAIVREVVRDVDVPVVLDALALAAVTRDQSCLHRLGGRVLLTPNLREMALTLGTDVAEVEGATDEAAALLARRSRATVSVGGETSWVAAPDGRLWCDPSGAAGLGVSGSGDVCAGIAAGLVARGAAVEQAAVWSRHLHGRAGERLSSTVGRLGYLARELPREVPGVLAEIEQ